MLKAFYCVWHRARANARTAFIPLSYITVTPGEDTVRRPRKGLTSGHWDTSQGNRADFVLPCTFQAHVHNLDLSTGFKAQDWQVQSWALQDQPFQQMESSPCISTIHTWGPSERQSIFRGFETDDFLTCGHITQEQRVSTVVSEDSHYIPIQNNLLPNKYLPIICTQPFYVQRERWVLWTHWCSQACCSPVQLRCARGHLSRAVLCHLSMLVSGISLPHKCTFKSKDESSSDRSVLFPDQDKPPTQGKMPDSFHLYSWFSQQRQQTVNTEFLLNIFLLALLDNQGRFSMKL